MAPAPVRGRRRRRKPLRWIGVALLALVAAPLPLLYKRLTRPADLAPGFVYVNDAGAVRRELRYVARRDLEPALEKTLQRVHDLASSGANRPALELLQGAMARLPVPTVYNNLGVLYERVQDRRNAFESFGRALQIDPYHAAARENMRRLRAPQPQTELIAELPVTREVEPNDVPLGANVISLNAIVSAAVEHDRDHDTFRFVTPAKPRDVLEISIENRSPALVAELRLSDDEGRDLVTARSAKAGASVVQFFSPQPGITLYARVRGHNRTTGAYTLGVRSMHAFDAYEPNEDLMHAAAIGAAATIEANIMDARDNDFYEIAGALPGAVELRLENRSPTLIPGMFVFGPDMRLLGFAPETHAGGSVTQTFTVAGPGRYYIQVSGHRATSGPYMLAWRQL